MARVAVIVLLALVAGAGVANAKLALCNANARPAKPTNVLVTRNMITPQGAGESRWKRSLSSVRIAHYMRCLCESFNESRV